MLNILWLLVVVLAVMMWVVEAVLVDLELMYLGTH
jgi:hypothetical protein